jgi:hypothetical protein
MHCLRYAKGLEGITVKANMWQLVWVLSKSKIV